MGEKVNESWQRKGTDGRTDGQGIRRRRAAGIIKRLSRMQLHTLKSSSDLTKGRLYLLQAGPKLMLQCTAFASITCTALPQRKFLKDMCYVRGMFSMCIPPMHFCLAKVSFWPHHDSSRTSLCAICDVGEILPVACKGQSRKLWNFAPASPKC